MLDTAGLAEAVKAQIDIEFVEQDWLMRTEDHREGIKANGSRAESADHRSPGLGAFDVAAGG